MPAARSLLAWLRRHAAHVQRLELDLDNQTAPYVSMTWGGEPWEQEEEEEDAVRSELAALVAECAAVCGRAGQLLELQLACGPPAVRLAWLPAMRSVQRLSVTSDRSMRLLADASGLTQLRSLQLGGHPLMIAAGVRLPPCITSLSIGDLSGRGMPEQVRGTAQPLRACTQRPRTRGRLPHAQRQLLNPIAPCCPLQAALPTLLELHQRGSFEAGSMAPLSRLTALTRLELEEAFDLPPAASLAALTALRRLILAMCDDWDGFSDEDVGTLDAALPALRQLTLLSLEGGVPEMPLAAGRLPQLQRLIVDPCSWLDVPPGPSLPAGFSSLQLLATD